MATPARAWGLSVGLDRADDYQTPTTGTVLCAQTISMTVTTNCFAHQSIINTMPT